MKGSFFHAAGAKPGQAKCPAHDRRGVKEEMLITARGKEGGDMSELEGGVNPLEENTAEFEEETPNETTKLTAPVETKLDQLLAALEALQAQFGEKIAVDTHKNALFNEMHQELIRYQNGILDKIVETMALDIIQMADSTKRSLRLYEEKEPSEDNYRRLLRVIEGIAEDLDDILYRQSIEPYQVAGAQVDVRRQKIVQTVETDQQDRDNLVAARVADGYEKNGKVIRPERIKIYKYSPG